MQRAAGQFLMPYLGGPRRCIPLPARPVVRQTLLKIDLESVIEFCHITIYGMQRIHAVFSNGVVGTLRNILPLSEARNILNQVLFCDVFPVH
jgi:hypothetical protein